MSNHVQDTAGGFSARVLHPKRVAKHEVQHAFHVSEDAWGQFMKALAKGRPEEEVERRQHEYTKAQTRAQRMLEAL